MFGLLLQRMRSGALILCAGVLFLSAGPVLAAGPEETAGPQVEVLDGRTLFKLGWGDDLCAITFDDGPSRHTPRLLEILKEHGVPATFFLVGNQIRYHGALVRRIEEEGHEIANHTLSHMTLRHRDPEVQREEMEAVQTMLSELGVVSRFIRPPYGRYDPDTIRIATELGLEIVLWSVDSMDWTRSLRVESMRTQVRGQKLRGIFLFHDTHAPTVDAMPEILDRLAADGCRFVSVSTYLDAVHSPASSAPALSVEKTPAAALPAPPVSEPEAAEPLHPSPGANLPSVPHSGDGVAPPPARIPFSPSPAKEGALPSTRAPSPDGSVVSSVSSGRESPSGFLLR